MFQLFNVSKYKASQGFTVREEKRINPFVIDEKTQLSIASKTIQKNCHLQERNVKNC